MALVDVVSWLELRLRSDFLAQSEQRTIDDLALLWQLVEDGVILSDFLSGQLLLVVVVVDHLDEVLLSLFDLLYLNNWNLNAVRLLAMSRFH